MAQKYTSYAYEYWVYKTKSSRVLTGSFVLWSLFPMVSSRDGSVNDMGPVLCETM